MIKKSFGLTQLQALFAKFHVDFLNGIWDAKQAYESGLNDVLKSICHESKWDPETFITLNISFSLFKEIILNCRIKSKEQNRTTSLEDTTISDITEVTKKIINRCKEQYKTQLKLYGKTTPPEWLVVAEFYNIEVEKKLREQIYFTHFNLDLITGENGIQSAITFSLQETAEYFTKCLHTQVSEENVLELCMTPSKLSFGVYLYEGQFTLENKHEPRSISSITNLLEWGFADKEYPYHYNGLLRITKKVVSDICGDIRNQTVEHLKNAGTIKVDSECNKCVVQPSMSNLIFGISTNIICMHDEEVIIDIHKLRFVKSEIMLYISTNSVQLNELFLIGNHAQLTKSYDIIAAEHDISQLLSRSAIKKQYTKITPKAWSDYLNPAKENSVPMIKGKTRQQDRFVRTILHKWLIENGHYTEAELNKLMTGINISSFKPIGM